MVDRANIKQMIPALPDEKIDMLAATSVLQQQAADIRNQRINWQSYFQSQMISKEDYDFIAAFDSSDAKTRQNKLKENPHQAAKTFLNLLGHVSKDQTIQYILTMIDDMLQEDRSRVEIFREHSTRKRESVWGPFLNLLNRQDGFIMNMTSRIIAKLACWSHDLMEKTDLQFYLTWLKDQLKLSNNEYIQSVARCLQMMLRIDEYRFAFVSVDGISTLLSVLSGRVNFQVQYQLIFCLWVLTFNPLLAEKMNKFNVIPILADILSDSVKEKVTRIILAVFRNLIEKVEDGQVSKEHCIAMVQCKVLKQLSILCQRKFDDEDITDDIEFLNDKLQASVQDLSSFDEYSTEVKSGRLEWSPVHKSGKFWRENASRLNEKNYELLRILVHLLETSKDPLVLSVASFDIGEYVRHYPRGKHIIEQLGGKQRVMQLLGHEDPNDHLRQPMRKPYGGALAIITSIGNIVRFDFRKGCQAVLWHAANIYVKKGSCMDEHDSKVFDTNIVQNLENPESMMIYCVMLRRVDKFQAEYNLCPGEFNDQVEPDIVKLKTSLTKLLSEWECGHYPKMITCFADSAAQNCILYRHFWADLQRKKLS